MRGQTLIPSGKVSSGKPHRWSQGEELEQEAESVKQFSPGPENRYYTGYEI